MGDLSRRSFLVGSALLVGATRIRRGLAGASAAAAAPLQVPDLPGDPFTLGVASGDPTPDGMVLWTRLAPVPLEGGGMPDVAVPVTWEVLDGPGGSVVADGTVVATPALAHSVHVEVAGLDPDTWYAYRFRVGDRTSPEGRTRTAPEDGCSPASLTIAAMSCQSYADGWYAAHRDVAERGPDLVAWLGDYIYEGGYSRVRTVPGGEATTLAGYRDRYALYKSDVDLQASHAACPWLVTWDDHEVDNDYAGDQPDGGGDPTAFLERRAQAYQAWWEHQPVRVPTPAGPDLGINRLVRWGSLAALAVLDGRQHRTLHPCGSGLGEPCPDMAADDVSMLGATQEAWLADVLASTPATWHVLAQQTVVVPTPFGPYVNRDQWDGYPAARRRLVELLARPEVTNPVILTGDIHAAIAADLLDGDGPDAALVARELVATGVSSTFRADLAAAFEAVLGGLPHVHHVDAGRRGYVWVVLTPTEGTATFRAVEDATVAASAVVDDHVWTFPAEPAGPVGCAAPASTTTSTTPPPPPPTSAPAAPGGPAPGVAPTAGAPTAVRVAPRLTG